jgi:hypothetical protein
MSSGGGSTTTKSNSQSQASWIPNSAFAPGYGFLGGNLQNLMQQPIPYYPMQTYVGPSGLTQQGVAGIQQGAEAMQPILGQAGANYGQLSNVADVANNPWVQGQIQANERSVLDTLQNKALPMLQQNAVGVNAMGSDRLGLAQGQAMGEASKALSNQNASTMLNAYGQGLQTQMGALGQTGNMLAGYLQPGMALGQAGYTVEDYQNRALQDAMQRFAYQYQEPWQRMQNVGNLLGLTQNTGTQYGSSAGTGTAPSQGGGIGGILGGAGSVLSGAAALGTLLSDRRLKRDIKRIGSTPSGIPVYSFNYLWGEPAVGVMSDEVPEEWVVRHPSGFDMVDYTRVR